MKKKKRILINATYPEEKRVAIVHEDTLVDFYVETAAKANLKGNIYKGVVTKVQPGLQAAFVDFGQKKHGFLQMKEIMPKCFAKNTKAKRPKIQDVMAKGHEMVVQVERDERDSKGASLSTYISIPGRYIVVMPGSRERVGVSRKIEGQEDRDRLKEVFSSLSPPEDMGFILRTAGSDKTGGDLANDLKYLTRLWDKIKDESKKVHAPALIYKEKDISVRTVRDYLTSDVSEVIADDMAACRNIRDFLKKTVPWRKINVKHYRGTSPLFEHYGIEGQIARMNERVVQLPSKGYLVIDKTEALTAIDVNSGRSARDSDIEDTALRTNLEAADEIARQLRLRDIGGLIIIDFIDMKPPKNRKSVEQAMASALEADKAHADISRISKFGIMEMTRERLRTAYHETSNIQCTVCQGDGFIMAPEGVAAAALRDIHVKVSKDALKTVTCRLPVQSANCLVNAKRDAIAEMQKKYDVKIEILADTDIAHGCFDVVVEKDPTKEVPEQKDEPQKAPTETRRRTRSPRRNPRAEPPKPLAEQTPQAEPNAEAALKPTAESEKPKRTRPPRRRRPSKTAKPQTEQKLLAEQTPQAEPNAEAASKPTAESEKPKRTRPPRRRRPPKTAKPQAEQKPLDEQTPQAEPNAEAASKPTAESEKPKKTRPRRRRRPAKTAKPQAEKPQAEPDSPASPSSPLT